MTVTYTKPGTNPLQDLASNDAAALSAQAVANNTGSTNNQPVFPTAPTTRSVAENTITATQFGTAVTATDADSSDTLYYTLPSGFFAFAIGSNTGQLQTYNANLDYEDTASYIVPVYVSDRKNAAGTADTAIDDTILVTINVTDVNEAPTISGVFSFGAFPENTTAVGTYTVADVDVGDSHTWSVESDDDGALFEISQSGVLSFKTAPDYDMPVNSNNAYVVTIKVTDNGSAPMSGTLLIDIEVADVNEPPEITTTGNTYTAITKPEGTATSEILATYQADDLEDGTLMWTKTGDDAGDFTITRNSSGHGELKFSAVPDFEIAADNGANNVYNVTVNVRDSNGSDVDDSIAVTITVTDADDAGTASISGALSGGSTLSAGLTDPDGGITNKTYQWQRGESASGAFTNILSNATSETYTLVAADVGKHLKVRVTYTDGSGSNRMAPSGARGPVGASNSAPTFSLMTATRTLPENSGVGVNVVGGVTAATDSDSDTLAYSLTGTDASKFDVDSNGQIKTKSTGSAQNFNFENASNNSFSVTVQVHDGKDAAGGSDTSTIDDTIVVTINLTNVNEEPMLTSPPSTKSVPENLTAVHTFAATDVDAMTTFSWRVTGADNGKFEISTSGVLTFRNAPDFETPTDTGDTDGDNIYVVTVRVDDNGSPMKNDVHTLRLTVTDVNEAPTIDSGPAHNSTINVNENTAISVAVGTYEASDVDAGTMLIWSSSGVDMGDFTLTSNGAGYDLKFKNVPNFEDKQDSDNDNDNEVTVNVTDGSLTATRNLTVRVVDVNEPPAVSGNASPSKPEIEYDASSPDLTVGTYTYKDEDRNPVDVITWDLSGADEMHFSISSGGDLSFSISPNFEVPVDMGSGNDYVIVVEADDGQGGVGTFNVTVTVTPVDETPEITSNNATQTFAEIEYDYVHAPAELEVDTFTARDEEDGTIGITWTLGGSDAGDFTISTGATTGEGLLVFKNPPNFEAPTNAGTDNVYEVTVIARDTTSPHKTRDYPVTVTVTEVNERPDISGTATQSYPEIIYNLGLNLTIPDAGTYTATDYDDGDTFTWDLDGVDADHFNIGVTSGVLTFVARPDYERPVDSDDDNTYDIIVQATDEHMYTGEFSVTIRITPINEIPEISDGPTSVTYDENAVVDVASYTGHDEETPIHWSLTGTDRGDFNISGTGTVTFKATPDFKAPTDANTDNIYSFNVKVSDGLLSGPERGVTVTVMDLEEAGTLTVDNLSPAVGDRVKFTLDDPDGGIDLTPPTPGQPPPILWNIELSTTSTGPWMGKNVGESLSKTFMYTIVEGDTDKYLRASVTYIDERGPGKSATRMESEAITADHIINAKPRFTAGGTQNVEEGDTGRTVGVAITASDRDMDSLTFGILDGPNADNFVLVMINSTTVKLKTAQALDFEMTSGLMFLQVAVHDGKGLDGSNNVMSDDSIDATTTVTINIIDVEEDGVVTLSDDEPGVGTPLITMFADGDGGVSVASWQWARSANGRTVWTNISGATNDSSTTTLADADFFLRARVTYADNRGAGKSAEAITTERVFGENQRPTFPSTESGARGGRELAGGRERRRPRDGRGPGGRQAGLHARGRGRRRLHHCCEHGAAAHEGAPELRDEAQLQRHRRGTRRAGRSGQHFDCGGRQQGRDGHGGERRGAGRDHADLGHCDNPGSRAGNRGAQR